MIRRWLVLLGAVVLLAAACTDGDSDDPADTAVATSTTTLVPTETTATAAPPGDDHGLYLMLMWHQHQPRYPLDDNGVVTRPWVRVHATKDYYDMAALHDEFPDVRATFNLTPILLLQLEELMNGTKDVYWTASEIPAAALSDEQKRFLMERFFDISNGIITRFPRYADLADLRTANGGGAAPLDIFTTQDYRDLQVLFNLGWTDPDFLAEEPLASLVAKGRDFAEDDKAVVFAEHERIISEVIPIHARLWDEGKIEVTTTPLAHPILPLISDSSLATVGDPAAMLPKQRFQEIPDADQQVIRGLDLAERLLGRRPVGMWPGEGGVAQLVMSLFSKNGVEWVGTGEDVLAQSLDIGSFTRSANDVVDDASSLYQPWQAELNRNPAVPMFFRDRLLSDLIGFEYSRSSGEAAADDFMRRLADIRTQLETQRAFDDPARPPVVSVILDGENAWEHYPNDGKDFLRALYRNLSTSDFVTTITPSEYLDRFGQPDSLDEVFPASWFQPNFATWIGESEEATAWDYLYEVRRDLEDAERSGQFSEEALAAAYDAMLLAEGSDWFWWYGSDQDSGDDGYFDRAYRTSLARVYEALDLPVPAFVDVPIIPERPIEVAAQPSALGTIVVDGVPDDEWAAAGRWDNTSGFIPQVRWLFDRESLYLRLDLPSAASIVPPLDVYIGAPEGTASATTTMGVPLGFGATHLLRIELDAACLFDEIPAPRTALPPSCETPIDVGSRGDVIEVEVPLTALGALESGDRLSLKLNPGESDTLEPTAGPVPLQIPDISNVEVAMETSDPIGDDHGPGTYTYPTDGVFTGGSYDLTSFSAGTEGDEVVFTFEIAGTIQNPWGSPRGVSVQTFDIYIDRDPGGSTGVRRLLDGRNASLGAGDGWEYAVTVEGWEPAIYLARADASTEETTPSFDVVVFGDKGKVVVRIPRDLLGDGDPSEWGYVAAVMSQEGFPSSGVRRIRDVDDEAAQWRLGGGPADAHHTRIVDIAWPVDGEQEQFLSDYPPTVGAIGDLSDDDFAQVPLLVAG